MACRFESVSILLLEGDGPLRIYRKCSCIVTLPLYTYHGDQSWVESRLQALIGCFCSSMLLGASRSLSTNSILLDQGLGFVCKYLISKVPVIQKRSIPSVLRRACIARICAARHLPRFLVGRSCRSRCSHSIDVFPDIFLESIDISSPKLLRVLEPTSPKHPPVCPSIDAFLRDIDYIVAIFPSKYRWR